MIYSLNAADRRGYLAIISLAKDFFPCADTKFTG
jgi:hypothetical protein